MRELYEVLGLSKKASARDIKRAYYTLAHRYHPDKLAAAAAENGTEQSLVRQEVERATDQFREVVFAYEVLADEHVRGFYNRFGMLGVHAARGTTPRSAADFGPTGERIARFVQRLAAKVQAQVADAQRMRAEQLAKLRANRSGRERGPDRSMELEVDVSVLLHGGQCALHLDRFVGCRACAGTGYAAARRPLDCVTCHGEGSLSINLAGVRLQAPCPHCGALGAEHTADCGSCAGTGAAAQRREVRVNVPSKFDLTSPLRLRGAGLPGPHGGPCGDLLLHLDLAPHPSLLRDGWHLKMDVQVDEARAQEGCAVQFTLAGTQHEVVVPRGGAVDIPRTVVIASAGLWRTDAARGDLHVRVCCKKD